MAHLQLRRQDTNERVLPVYYSDNYVSLLPGENRTVSIEASSHDLGGSTPLVVLDGWNVTTDWHVFDGPVTIAVNTDAQVDANPKTGLTLVPQSRSPR
jgi:beta-mannosidase